jgi:putative transposase
LGCICEGAKEDKSGWSAFLRHLVDRGLKGVQLIISDACRGLLESAAEYLPGARWQRCMVHFYRNVFSHVPTTKVRDVSHMLKAIHAQESREAADRKARAIVDDLRAARMNTAADLVERGVSETVAWPLRCCHTWTHSQPAFIDASLSNRDFFSSVGSGKFPILYCL